MGSQCPHSMKGPTRNSNSTHRQQTERTKGTKLRIPRTHHCLTYHRAGANGGIGVHSTEGGLYNKGIRAERRKKVVRSEEERGCNETRHRGSIATTSRDRRPRNIWRKQQLAGAVNNRGHRPRKPSTADVAAGQSQRQETDACGRAGQSCHWPKPSPAEATASGIHR